jgi:hypothetical protein
LPDALILDVARSADLTSRGKKIASGVG